MRIRRIELNGFKSFMDRTAIELPDGVTAIVGPNGCGKSNIVDAIRWVLGEQSPKHLRGASMEDVIFAGNAQQGPLGMAEVSLLLERSEEDLLQARIDDDEGGGPGASDLPPELAHASEVLVTRRYFRSGESEYFINRAPCRLRDITELFLGTGVGTKAYAIIEQGRVEQLVSAKPDDLRLFIEEAAGTTRFRTRKQSAERKMARTRDNLVRVEDVLREQQRQMASLERQAKRAEEYHRLKGELRILDLGVAANQYAGMLRRRHELALRLGSARSDGGRLERAIVRLRASTADARHSRTEVETELQELDATVTTARVTIADGSARIESLEVRATDATDQLARSREAAERARAAAAHLREELQAAASELAASRDAASADEEREIAATRALEHVRARGPQVERDVENAKDALVEAIGEETRLRNMDEALRARQEELSGRRQRVEEEHKLVGERLDANHRARDAVQTRMSAIGEREQACLSEQTALSERRPTLTAAVEAAGCRVDELRRAWTLVDSKRASLEELQNRLEGCTRGTASLLERGELACRLLADVLRVPAALERAVAVALGGRLGDVVVDSTAEAKAAIEWLVRTNGGSARALPREPERRSAVIVSPGKRLLDEIEVDPAYWSLFEGLLGDVLLTDDLEAALASWSGAPHPVTVVTRAGEAIDALGAVRGGSEPPLEETLLSRRRELRDLQDEVERAAATLARETEEFTRARDALAANEEDLRNLSERRQEIELERVAAEKDRDRLEEERARLAAELEVSALEVSGLIGAGGEVSTELASVHAAYREASSLVESRREALETVTKGLVAWRDEMLHHEQARTDAAVAYAATSERIRSSELMMQQRNATLEDIESRIRTEDAAAAWASQTVDQLVTERAAAERMLDEARAVIAALAITRESLNERLTALRSTVEGDDEKEELLRDRLDRLRQRKGDWEVQLAEARLKVQAIDDRLRERYDVGLDALPCGVPGVDPSDAERAEALRARLVRLGDVNPAAIDELQEIRERHDFAQSQRNDLEKSLADLENTIEALNRTCRQRFRDTFDAANIKLSEVFPQLFPGGKARLELVEAEDAGDGDEVREAGVEIVVQPAGKKLQSLNLLSGGEKALTATALVFSLFLIRPTPFCLLDEVDAPLDEANIGRFNHMVRSMAATSQFVVVTHNRRTMEGANTLYGITMEQAGVSKVVSVRLNEAA